MNLNGVLDQLTLGDHVCAPVACAADARKVAAVHTAHGLREQHRIILHTTEPDALRATLMTLVPGAGTALTRGQIRLIAHWHPWTARAGPLPGRLAALAERTRQDGYTGLSLVVHHSRRYQPGEFESLLQNETQVNSVFAAGGISAVCTYQPGGFAPWDWKRLVAAHPSTVVPTAADAVARLRCVVTTTGVRLSGEADLANREALPVLLSAVASRPGPCLIDAVDLTFADAQAIGCLLQLAQVRGCRGTTITCGPHLGELFGVVGAGRTPYLTVVVRPEP